MAADPVSSLVRSYTSKTLAKIKEAKDYPLTQEVLIARLNNPKLKPEDRKLLIAYIKASDKTRAKKALLGEVNILFIHKLTDLDMPHQRYQVYSDRLDALLYAMESVGISRQSVMADSDITSAYLLSFSMHFPESNTIRLQYGKNPSEDDINNMLRAFASRIEVVYGLLNSAKDQQQMDVCEREIFSINCVLDAFGCDSKVPIAMMIKTVMPGVNDGQYMIMADMWQGIYTPEKYDDDMDEAMISRYVADDAKRIALKEGSYDALLKSEEHAQFRTFAIKTMNLNYVLSVGNGLTPDRVFYGGLLNGAYLRLSRAEARSFADYYVYNSSDRSKEAQGVLMKIREGYKATIGQDKIKTFMYEDLSRALNIPLQ